MEYHLHIEIFDLIYRTRVKLMLNVHNIITGTSKSIKTWPQITSMNHFIYHEKEKDKVKEYNSIINVKLTWSNQSPKASIKSLTMK